ncbi:MAG: hypothetical protein UH071_06430 [Paludibacteraceae bacterium]|nr:hypothetical protein [Paludibacteraceae bacterium]
MNKTLLSQYEEIANKYVGCKLIAKGIRCCNNKHKGGLLLTGVNPNGKEKEETDKQFALDYQFVGNEKPYYIEKLKMLETLIVKGINVSYLDLFPLRLTEEKVFNTFIKEHTDIGAAFLSITKQEIENIAPKLIIHANKSSAFYWGTNKKYPWMGYKLEKIEWKDIPLEDPLGSSVLYRIVGINNNDNVVGNDIKTSKLTNNSYLFVCKMMGKTGGGQVPYLTPDYVYRLWEWCNKI